MLKSEWKHLGETVSIKCSRMNIDDLSRRKVVAKSLSDASTLAFGVFSHKRQDTDEGTVHIVNSGSNNR